MRAAVIHLLTTVLLLPLLLAPPPAAASGADPLIEYSADGQAWSQQPPALFPGARLIPGGTATSTLWIRHRAPLPAQVSLTAGDAAGNDLPDWLDLHVAGTPLAAGQTWHGPTVDPGAVITLEIDVAVRPDVPLSARNERVPVLSHLTVRAHPSEGSDREPGDADPPPADSPATEAPGSLSVAGWAGAGLLAIALLLVLLGAALGRRRRAPV